jgi:hypothetical protein
MWLHPLKELELRQTVLGWAVATTQPGEGDAAILARAEGFRAFLMEPLRPEVIQAAQDLEATSQAARGEGRPLKLH